MDHTNPILQSEDDISIARIENAGSTPAHRPILPGRVQELSSNDSGAPTPVTQEMPTVTVDTTAPEPATIEQQIAALQARETDLRRAVQRQQLEALKARVRDLENDLEGTDVPRDSTARVQLPVDGTLPMRVPVSEVVQDTLNSSRSESLIYPDSSASYTDRSSKRTHVTIEEDAPSSKKRRLTTIDKYKGKTLDEHTNFVRACTTQFMWSPANFQSDEDRVIYAMQHLEGAPRNAWYQYFEAQLTPVFDWLDFVSFLRDIIVDPLNREMDVQQKYTDAKQKPDQTVRAFDMYLNTLEAQMELQTEGTRRDAFLTRLREDIRLVIKNQTSIPVTRESVVALAARIEANQKESKNTSSHGQRSSKGQSSNNRGSQSKGRDHGKDRQKDSGGKLKKTERSNDDWKSNIECYNCHEMGHYSNECKKPKKEDSGGKQGKVNQVDAGKGKAAQKTQERRKQSARSGSNPP